ncbi:MAG: beta-L-arabinofuranosidase domain-containing protein [Planctomycetota bacterium]
MHSTSLYVTESYGVERDSEAVQLGVPIGKGRLSSSDNVRLIDDTGQQVPAQFSTLSVRADGSIRWLEVFFLCSVKGRSQRTYRLEYGDSAQCPTESDSSFISENTDAFGVDTGRARFAIGKKPFSPLKQVWTGNEPIFNNGDIAEVVVRSGDGKEFRLSKCRDATFEIESSGPLKVVLKATGKHATSDGKTFLDFEIRLRFIKGTSQVRISYTFINREGYDIPKEIIAAQQHWMKPKLISSEVKSISLRIPAAIKQTDNVRFHLDGSVYPPGCGYALNTKSKKAKTELTFDIADRSGGKIGSEIGAQGLAAAGNFAAVLRDFGWNCPKQLWVDKNAVTFVLVPENDEDLQLVQGVAKTHHVLVDFAMNPENVSSLRQFYYASDYPVTAYVDHKSLADSQTLGKIFAYRPDKYPFFEQYIDDCLKMGRKMSHLGMPVEGMGMLNYGDEINIHFSMARKKRWSYTNNRWDFLQAVLLGFLRTGDTHAFSRAFSAAEHTMDVDICHHSCDLADVGGIHGCEKAEHVIGGIPPSTFQSWAEGLVTYYWVTGEKRALENAKLAGDFMIEAGKTGKNWAKNVRGTGIPLMLLAALYEATGEKKYIDGAKPYIENLMDMDAEGAWRVYDPPSMAVAAAWKTSIALAGLARYIEASGDESLNEIFIRGAYWLIDKGVTPNGFFYYYDMPDHSHTNVMSLCLEPLGRAYELTGNRRFLDVGLKNFKYLIFQRPGLNWEGPSPVGNMEFAVLARGCFRFLYWLDSEGMLEDI